MTTPSMPQHWTEIVYQENARLLYDVEAAVFQNHDLTKRELDAVAQLAERVGSSIQSPVIDIACGPGRHSIALAEQGHEVTGLDFSPGLLELARESAAASGYNGRGPLFVSGDMRKLEYPDNSFQTVLMLGNSFGYFSDEDNETALKEAYRVLAKGGFLCVEITNKELYLKTFEPFMEEIVEGRFNERLRCEWRKTWDAASRRVTTWEKHSAADTGELLYEGPYDVRLFDHQEFIGMLEEKGLRSVTCMPFSPGRDSLEKGLGETFGAMEEIVFMGGIK